MKPFEQFIGQMMESARRVQARDPKAATDVIQQALAQAGLLAPQQKTGAPPPAPEFVDLNPPPAWSKPRPRPRPAPGADSGLPGRFIAGSHACEAGSRRYKLYVPAHLPAGRRPLIVMLHGCTQDPDDFATGTGMNALAEETGCLVLYPEQDGRANRSHCWNWFEPGHQARGAGEPGILAGMTRQVMKDHDAEPSQVFVAGMSAGGAMAAVLGAEYPELFAAIGVHSGLPAGSARDMISGLQAMKKPGRARSLREAVPIIVFHGDADHVVNAANGEAVLKQFVGAHAGLRATPLHASEDGASAGGRRSTRRTWRDEEGQVMAEHWTVHGAGHAWAGGNPAGSHTDALGPDASREMLRFFLNR
ncbi:alpha/beta hydrolase family esterase [Telluria beijingensis]|uniref:extracellular catalytic domain type 1 short-chain-length polyhydroxyalkanoate depolymerase n=1 Tax=Telluria beijingensis TaxID=3068633 RepID=UPI00279618A1|nr:PHB depolymerase family esterase [Massilia sp. REN29]